MDFLDIQILSSLEKQAFRSAYSLAEIRDVSQTMIVNHGIDCKANTAVDVNHPPTPCTIEVFGQLFGTIPLTL
jgi:hypothetical protein